MPSSPPSYAAATYPVPDPRYARYCSLHQQYCDQSCSEPHEGTPLVNNKGKSKFLRSKYVWVKLVIILLLTLNVYQYYTNYTSICNPAHRDRLQRKRDMEDAKRERVFQERTLNLDTREQRIEAKERAMKEDEERRKRAALSWVDLTAEERCLEYNSRHYRAELKNVPFDEDANKWCMETPVEIRGVVYKRPDYCVVEHAGQHDRRIVAYWTVRSNEPTCMTRWAYLSDKGCGLRGSRNRVFEAQLVNHRYPWDNWREMCSTTPIRFNGHVFDHPVSCENRGINGIWGSWTVRDDWC